MNRYTILKVLCFFYSVLFAIGFLLMLVVGTQFEHYVIGAFVFLAPSIALIKFGLWASKKEKTKNLEADPDYYSKKSELKENKVTEKINKKEAKKIEKNNKKEVKKTNIESLPPITSGNPIKNDIHSLSLEELISKDHDRIARESLEIIGKTKNPETFFSRYDLALKHMNNQNKKLLINSFDSLCNEFIYRFDNAISTKLFSLKTEKAKLNNLEKFKESFNPHIYRLSEENKNLYNSLLAKYDQNIKKKLPDINSNPISTSNNLPENFIKSIPGEVFNLLWFKNGPFKNFEKPIDNISSKNGVELEISFSSDEEPSALDVFLPIKQGVDDEKIGYYPAYSDLNEVQRYQYLNWLKDINQEIDISYVFIFYYGLERYLFTAKWKDACNMIYKLQKNHSNGSFYSYSSDALLMTALKHKEISLLEMLDKEKIQPLAYASIKGALAKSFNANDIVSFSRIVGWTNKRYIDSEYDLFLSELEKNLKNTFNSNEYYVDPEEYRRIKTPVTLMLANYSLNINDRKFEIPDILSSIKIKTDLYKLLETAHNAVKIILRERRKKEKNKEN